MLALLGGFLWLRLCWHLQSLHILWAPGWRYLSRQEGAAHKVSALLCSSYSRAVRNKSQSQHEKSLQGQSSVKCVLMWAIMLKNKTVRKKKLWNSFGPDVFLRVHLLHIILSGKLICLHRVAAWLQDNFLHSDTLINKNCHQHKVSETKNRASIMELESQKCILSEL